MDLSWFLVTRTRKVLYLTHNVWIEEVDVFVLVFKYKDKISPIFNPECLNRRSGCICPGI